MQETAREPSLHDSQWEQSRQNPPCSQELAVILFGRRPGKATGPGVSY